MSKLKQVIIYLPEEKHEALKAVSKAKRIAVTKLLESAVDEIIKEGKDLQ